MTAPSEGIKDLLVNAGVAVFASPTGWSLSVSKQTEIPHELVTVYDSGGSAPNPRWLVDFPSVQVRVRGAPNAYQSARSKCDEVKNALLGLDSQDINGDRWISIAMGSDITFIGYDDRDRPNFTLNFNLIIEPATGTHRDPV